MIVTQQTDAENDFNLTFIYLADSYSKQLAKFGT